MAEKFEANYLAVMKTRDLDEFMVVAYFSNHKQAFCATELHGEAAFTQTFRRRAEAQDHAEFLIKEFAMGSKVNPIAILHLNEDREVMYRDPHDNRWISTGRKVDLL